jgi:molecular chaperone DnaK
VKEAEQYAEEDAKRKDEVDTRNHADQMVYQSEKTLDEMGDKIEAGDKQTIEAAIEKVKSSLNGTETQAIKDAVAELEKAFYAVSEKLYSQAPGPDGAPGGPDFGGAAPGGDAGGDEFYDADYEVVDEE